MKIMILICIAILIFAIFTYDKWSYKVWYKEGFEKGGYVMDQWIDVNKRLPVEDGRVLVFYYCAEDYTKTTGAYFFRCNNGTYFWELDDDNQELCFVTHWQELPEPPTKIDGKEVSLK